MLKALFKKQLLELGDFYFRDRKTGKRRSTAGVILYAALFAFLFLALAGTFFGLSFLLADGLLFTGMDWLYFCLIGMLAIFLGVFGSVFNTYAHLFKAKDNELLLSMPIPPMKILFVRMVSVYLLGLLYESLVMIPAVVMYWIMKPVTFLSVLLPVLLIFVIAFLVTTLSCLFGWLVALISSKLKNKSFITVLISLVFFAVYYYACMNFTDFVTALVENSEQVGGAIKTAAYPFYLMGCAGDGDPLAMLIFSLIVAALFALTCFVMSKTFLKIALKNDSSSKKVYKEQAVKTKSPSAALFKKEWRRLASSPTYMLNCALGTVFMPVVAVIALIFMPRIQTVLALVPIPKDVFCPLIVAAVGLISSMNDITAPSVSLEGNNIWILQTMPVSGEKVLNAKQWLHWALTMPPAVLLAVVLSIVVGVEAYNIVLIVASVLLFIMLSSALGLAINLKKPNLSWTNETVPIKQSFAVFICMFGGWLISIIIGGLGFLTASFMKAEYFLAILLVVLVVVTRLINGWLRTKGAEIFEKL